jgi:hypothetical protein
MENTKKLRVLLQHWIEHNISHAEEFDRWREIAEKEGESAIAGHIAEAIGSMRKANEALDQALSKAGGPAEDDHHHHHHHHHH